MKRKTINAVLSKKVGEWWATLPDDIREQVERDTIVTGGSIASMLLREKVNDFDVYFRTRDTALKVAKHYVKEFVGRRREAAGIPINIYLANADGQPLSERDAGDRIKVVVKSAGIASDDDSAATYAYFEGRPPEEAQEYVGEVMDDPATIEDVYQDTEAAALENDEPYRAVFLSTNAITLSRKVQIIIRFWGEPEEIHKNYDFVHCTNYWTKKDGVVLRQEALESLLSRELRYFGSRYPIASMIRVRKFVARGWTINAGQIVKMAFQIGELNLSNLSVLEDQLTGVDVAYFTEVIGKLKAKDPETVDSAYLVEIINRMF